jgi:hypothetical protein
LPLGTAKESIFGATYITHETCSQPWSEAREEIEHVSLLTEIAQRLLRHTDIKEPPSNCDPITRIIVPNDFFFSNTD